MGLPVEAFAHDVANLHNDVSNGTAASKRSTGSLQLPCPKDSQQPLTVFVKHNVLPSKLSAFECWCNETTSLAKTYEGYISTEVIKPVCHKDECDDGISMKPSAECDEYISIVRFKNYALLKQWIDSDDRRGMLERTLEFSNAKSKYTYHSLEHWFPSNTNCTNLSNNNGITCRDERKSGPPPKWKMVFFTTFVIYIQTLWIPKITKNIFPNLNNNAYVAGLLNTFLMVSVVTYIGAPILSRLAAFWLFPHENYRNKLKELIPKRPKWDCFRK